MKRTPRLQGWLWDFLHLLFLDPHPAADESHSQTRCRPLTCATCSEAPEGMPNSSACLACDLRPGA
jgi:hypothetical protein